MCGSLSGRASRRSPAHFSFRCNKSNGCYEGLEAGEEDILEIVNPKLSTLDIVNRKQLSRFQRRKVRGETRV